jgi:hypothetical protein
VLKLLQAIGDALGFRDERCRADQLRQIVLEDGRALAVLQLSEVLHVEVVAGRAYHDVGIGGLDDPVDVGVFFLAIAPGSSTAGAR